MQFLGPNLMPHLILFHQHGLLKIHQLNTFHNACTMFTVVNMLNPRLGALIPISYPSHPYQTRTRFDINGKKRKLTCTRNSIAYKGPKSWNKLHRDLQVAPTMKVFKKRLKRQLLMVYTKPSSSWCTAIYPWLHFPLTYPWSVVILAIGQSY